MKEQKVILITGTSSGFGYTTALLLAEYGFRVYGTSRDPTNKNKTDSFEVLRLEVCSDESVAGCV